MGTISEVETPTAIKQHRCEWCWQPIMAGEQYRRYRYWNDGDVGTVKLHAECLYVLQDAAADEGGWLEWTPGSGERPNVEFSGQAASPRSSAEMNCWATTQGDTGMDKISVAAKMAGDWWAARLSDEHADKREAFSIAVAKMVDDALRGKAYWVRGEGRKEGNGDPRESIYTGVDYDPQGLMLDAVREVVDPECRGMMFSARGILPQKHGLWVYVDKLVPKEGYGNWTAPILVPNAKNQGDSGGFIAGCSPGLPG